MMQPPAENQNQFTNQPPAWLVFELIRLGFLENEIRIAREIHVHDPLKKVEGERWAKAREEKMQQIKFFIDRKTKADWN